MTGVVFPAVLYGTSNQVEQGIIALAAVWARSTGAFPVLEDRATAAGELVNSTVDARYDPAHPAWRLYAITDLLYAALEDRPDKRAIRATLEGGFAATSWWTLIACASQRGPHTADAVGARARVLLASWDALNTLRYVSKPRLVQGIVSYPPAHRAAVSFDEYVAELFAGPLAVWSDPDRQTIRERLEQALHAMVAATPSDARARLIARMVVLARDNPRLRDRPALADATLITSHYDAMTDNQRAELRPGESASLTAALQQLARKLPT
ncbi:MAG: hypothetical protein ABJE66_20115 [Deltaproteobacteria bacterium]